MLKLHGPGREDLSNVGRLLKRMGGREFHCGYGMDNFDKAMSGPAGEKIDLGDVYQTPESYPVSWLARIFPTLCFYPPLASIVLRAALQAKRGRYSEQAWMRSSEEVFYLFQKCGANVRLEGLDVLKQLNGGPAVFIGNHMSTAETFLLPMQLVSNGLPATFVVKKSLVEYPVFKHIMISRNPVVVGRENARDDLRTVLEEGSRRLQAGVSLVIFPQKTRTVMFDREEFNSIGVKLARKSGVPVVPVAVKTDAWRNGRLLKDYGPFDPKQPVRFAFGAPIEVEGNGREANEAVIEFIETKLRSWGHPVK